MLQRGVVRLPTSSKMLPSSKRGSPSKKERERFVEGRERVFFKGLAFDVNVRGR